MKYSVEITVKKIILENYRGYKCPIGRNELERLVRQIVGTGFSSAEFSSVLRKLKKGMAVIEKPRGCFSPNYDEVEV